MRGWGDDSITMQAQGPELSPSAPTYEAGLGVVACVFILVLGGQAGPPRACLPASQSKQTMKSEFREKPRFRKGREQH